MLKADVLSSAAPRGAAAIEAVTHRFIAPSGTRISYETYGEGPPLVLIHGGFSDHQTNWAYVRPLLEPHFTVYALARRGRGATDATDGHGLEDEMEDAAALIRRIAAPVFLLGHSYGAHVALGAAARVPIFVRKLVLYEAPWPGLVDATTMAKLEALARAGDWDGFATMFLADVLAVPPEVLEALRGTEDWEAIVADAPASLGDLRAISRYVFDPERYSVLMMPVLLQVGSESPPELYVTDALATVLPKVSIGELDGQAHEGMTTAPEQYASAIRRFL